uniref:Uncharacterized protein n=1 Tax=Rhizophora mucronata TaxID=61149 RepID=A0A2P2LUT3_RHIMU
MVSAFCFPRFYLYYFFWICIPVIVMLECRALLSMVQIGLWSRCLGTICHTLENLGT